MTLDVIGLGALNMDYLYRVGRLLEDDEAVVTESISSPGGSAANTIFGLARLGLKTGFAGVVGDDADGKRMLQDFQDARVDTSQVRVKAGANTGSVLCLSDQSGQRSLHVVPGANDQLSRDDLDLSYLNQAQIVHLSSFAGERQFQISAELIPELAASVKVSFAPGAIYALKGLKALAPILARTHLLFINLDEIEQLTGRKATAGVEDCLNLGCHIVVVTMGKGTTLKSGGQTVSAVGYIRDTKKEYIIEAGEPEKVIDTTGAGDAFATGFLYGLLKKKGLEECGRLGDIVARLAITKLGTRPGFPTPDELAKRYQERYGQRL
jgi:ribokinase